MTNTELRTTNSISRDFSLVQFKIEKIQISISTRYRMVQLDMCPNRYLEVKYPNISNYSIQIYPIIVCAVHLQSDMQSLLFCPPILAASVRRKTCFLWFVSTCMELYLKVQRIYLCKISEDMYGKYWSRRKTKSKMNP